MFEEKVKALRYRGNGLIICQRESIKEKFKDISNDLRNDVLNTENETEIEKNIIYALKEVNRPWKRATLKFVRGSVYVMQFLDINGVVDVGDGVNVRKIRDR